jgi:hypothetical protein
VEAEAVAVHDGEVNVAAIAVAIKESCGLATINGCMVFVVYEWQVRGLAVRTATADRGVETIGLLGNADEEHVPAERATAASILQARLHNMVSI